MSTGTESEFDQDEIRGYPSWVYEFLTIIGENTPLRDEWIDNAVSCELFGLLSIDGVDNKAASMLGATYFATKTKKGAVAEMLGPRPQSDSPSENKDAVWLGDGKVQVGDEPPMTLPFQEATVLQALIEAGGTASRPELEDKSLVTSIPSVMKRLKHRFPQHVITPRKRGQGGYQTTIRPAE